MNKQCFIYIDIVSTVCIGDAWGHGEATKDGENDATVKKSSEKMIKKVGSKLGLAQRQ